MTEPLRIPQILRAPVGGLFRHVVADDLHTDSLSEERLERLRPFAPLGIISLPIPRNRCCGARRPAAPPVPLAR